MNEEDNLLDELKVKLVGKNKQQKNRQRLLVVIPAAIFILLLVLGSVFFIFKISYASKFFPGSYIGDISVGGLSKDQAFNLVDKAASDIEQNGVKIVYEKNKTVNLQFNSVEGLSDPDLSQSVLNFDEHKTVFDAYDYGRAGNWFSSIWLEAQLLVGSRHFPAYYNLDETVLDKVLRQNFADLEQPIENAKPKVTCQGADCRTEILAEKSGLTFDYAKAIAEIKVNLSRLSENGVELLSVVSYPTMTKDMFINNAGLVDRLLAQSAPRFFYKDRVWNMSKTDLASMLEFATGTVGTLGINQESFNYWLTKNIANDIDVAPKNANVEIVNGQPVSVSTHQSGLEVDREKAFADLNNKLASGDFTNLKITVSVKVVEPETLIADVNDLGIKEIIGSGQSSFAGSPSNRIHNIKTGAGKVHGTLILPGEEFSLIKVLGDVDGSTGYLPELVIKGNKTMPEFGGGLCQIGTTVFRAAMGSGLPITERRNHSYNVTYYLENGLPGVDATIYIPHPDVRFINDTGKYILIQAKISGSKLTFEFWGTKDGRKAERTKPQVWGWITPPDTKYIPSPDLKPGQKKCTESAHKGVSASFDYAITYASGEVKKQTFVSHYKPWQAVCLVGGSGSSTSTSSTIPVITSSTPASTTTSTP
ncbi:MAG: VanW family protein [Patescibacteria group bacterium]